MEGGGGAGDLQKAAGEGDLERVQRLLDAGTDACEGSEDGMTPLMLAAQNGHAEVVRALLQASAPWNALNPLGQCAGDFAMEAGHQEAFDVLLDAGTSVLIPCNCNSTMHEHYQTKNLVQTIRLTFWNR